MQPVDYCNERLSLHEAVRSETFPFFVKTCGDFKSNSDDVTSAVMTDTLIYVEARRTIEFVHVKVLDLHDEQQAQRDHNDDFVAERGVFVGEDLLVPLHYPGKLKYFHRPNKRTRYASVAQVIEDMPRLVRVDEEVVSVPPGGSGRNTLVPAGSRLLVRKVFTCSLDNTRYLTCGAGPATYTFSENARINFTAVPDPKTYTLRDCMKYHTLRSVVQFVELPPGDASSFADISASNTITIAEGPLELHETVHLDVLIGWVRDKQWKSYKTLILPQGMWKSLIVQTVKLTDEQLKASFREERFKNCPDSEFVENTLYVANQNQNEIIWLKSPKLFLYSPNAYVMKQALPIDYEDSDGEAEPNYQEMPPPLPARVPIEKEKQASVVDSTMVIKEAQHKKKSLFAAVHDDIKSWFKKRKQIPGRYEEVDSKTPADVYKSLKRPDVGSQRPLPSLPVHNNEQDKRQLDQRLQEDPETEYDYPILVPEELPPPPRPPPMHTHWQATVESNTSPGDQKGYVSPACNIDEAKHVSDDGTDDDDGDYLVPVQSPDKHDQECSVTPETRKDMEYISRGGQTSDDFYKLTVSEVNQLFKYCQMGHLADICRQQMMDGAFFKSFDLSEMGQEPFNATELQINKLKQIIYRGWRPKID